MRPTLHQVDIRLKEKIKSKALIFIFARVVSEHRQDNSDCLITSTKTRKREGGNNFTKRHKREGGNTSTKTHKREGGNTS